MRLSQRLGQPPRTDPPPERLPGIPETGSWQPTAVGRGPTAAAASPRRPGPPEPAATDRGDTQACTQTVHAIPLPARSAFCATVPDPRTSSLPVATWRVGPGASSGGAGAAGRFGRPADRRLDSAATAPLAKLA